MLLIIYLLGDVDDDVPIVETIFGQNLSICIQAQTLENVVEEYRSGAGRGRDRHDVGDVCGGMRWKRVNRII